MYQIGDRVVYGIQGICCVTGFEEKTVDRKSVSYLVLEPVNRDGARYMVPTHNEKAMAKLRPLLSRQDMEALLTSDEIRQDNWIRDENQRKLLYRELISGGDRMALLRMVHSLYLNRKAQTAAGKKIHLADENFLRDAEKLLCGEIAVVMEMEPEQAGNYLRTMLNVE